MIAINRTKLFLFGITIGALGASLLGKQKSQDPTQVLKQKLEKMSRKLNKLS